jgi:type II secretory pathway pseudopilin PulG
MSHPVPLLRAPLAELRVRSVCESLQNAQQQHQLQLQQQKLQQQQRLQQQHVQTSLQQSAQAAAQAARQAQALPASGKSQAPGVSPTAVVTIGTGHPSASEGFHLHAFSAGNNRLRC